MVLRAIQTLDVLFFFLLKKKLSDEVRSEIPLVLRNMVSTGQYVGA